MSILHRNLVICPIGPNTLHKTWLAGPETPAFDLFLIHFGDQSGFGREEATYYLERKGFKFEHLNHVAQHQAAILRRYENIWCPDDDLLVDTAGINRLFEIFAQYRLQLAQPALAKGEMTYATLRQRPGLVLRYTPFVEVGAPIFSQEAFWRVSPTFVESKSGWGLDILWPRFFGRREMAVIDAVGVDHTGPIGKGALYQNLAKLGISPRAELDAIIAKYGGFDPERHQELIDGRIKLSAVRDRSTPASLRTRMIEGLGMLPKVA